MNIEVKIDKNYSTPQVIILSNKMTNELSSLVDTVKNIDFKIIGTLIFNFKSGNKAYSSRRYIPKIKKFLEI